MVREQIQFCINGICHSINDERAFLSLAEYVRDHCRLVGTKVVCNEGDCGACTVLVGRFNRQTQTYNYQALDSCIVCLFQLDGTNVITVEGIGDPSFLSPIQQAMVRCHGSQCGYCTPGFVMAMHGMVEASVQPSESSLRYELSGNLCRCTGYSAIIEAGLQMNAENCIRMNTRYRPEEVFSLVGEDKPQSIKVQTALGTIFIPTDLNEAAIFRQSNPNATIVNGATDYGVLRNHGRLQATDTLCLVKVEGFQSITFRDGNLSIGGGASWFQIENAVREVIPEYYAVLNRFGSPRSEKPGRSVATLRADLRLPMQSHFILPWKLKSSSFRRMVVEGFH